MGRCLIDAPVSGLNSVFNQQKSLNSTTTNKLLTKYYNNSMINMRSAKSVSLDIAYWTAIDDYRKKRGLPSVSAALEEILSKQLKVGT